jgi:hypothetical protein
MTQAEPNTLAEETIFPLVITLDTDNTACVSGATPDRRWLRPEPVLFEEVSGATPLYQYFQPVTIELAASRADDARPEDRHVVGAATHAGAPLSLDDQGELLVKMTDASVDQAFAGLRSVGVVHVEARRLYRQRSTGGKRFVRLAFTDTTGVEYDWIVRDVRFLAPFPDPAHPDDADWLEGFAARLKAEPFYMSIGLTKPTGRFPGQFRGCHPLVVGVHGATEELLMRSQGRRYALGTS